MIPTLQIFTRALLAPDLSLLTLTDARAATEAGGMPRLMRTTRFIEAEITWRGAQWLLSMPLSHGALFAVERTASRLGRLTTDRLTEYRILPGELRWTDAAGCLQSCDLVLQHLPAGEAFSRVLREKPAGELLAALDALQNALRELNFTHNNLRGDNLRWSGGRFLPLRYHDACFDTPGDDDAAFEALREQIRHLADPMCVSDVTASYSPLRRLTGHLRTGNVHEGLVWVEDADGFGYVDRDNNPVIPAQFLWAGDFHEGRAEVETPMGMGLIDRQGCYVIPPEYEIVSYKPAESIVRVRKNGLWAEFDYLGRQTSEFGTVVGV